MNGHVLENPLVSTSGAFRVSGVVFILLLAAWLLFFGSPLLVLVLLVPVVALRVVVRYPTLPWDLCLPSCPSILWSMRWASFLDCLI